MEKIWGGRFLPFIKHVAGVKFIPVVSMDYEDWEILDYPNLRPQATKKLQKAILDKKVNGFFRVEIDMHKSHGGKEAYYWPGNSEEADQFDPETFENFEDYAKDVEPFVRFNNAYDRVNAMDRALLLAALIAAGIEKARAERWTKWMLVLAYLILIEYAWEVSEEDEETLDDEEDGLILEEELTDE